MGNQKTVIKVGTSTLTYDNGKVNYRRIESLCKVLADLQNSGEDIMLVSSGAIGVGMGKTGLSRRPTENKKKQALAAIGQCELMFMYDKIFGEYNHSVAQILLTGYPPMSWRATTSATTTCCRQSCRTSQAPTA